MAVSGIIDAGFGIGQWVSGLALVYGLWQALRPISSTHVSKWAKKHDLGTDTETELQIRAYLRQNRRHRGIATIFFVLAFSLTLFKYLFVGPAVFAGYLAGSVSAELVRRRSKSATVASLLPRRLLSYISPAWIATMAALTTGSFVLILAGAEKNIPGYTCPDGSSALPSSLGAGYTTMAMACVVVVMSLAIALLGAFYAVRRRQSASSVSDLLTEEAFRRDSIRACVGGGISLALSAIALSLVYVSEYFYAIPAVWCSSEPRPILPITLGNALVDAAAGLCLVIGATCWYVLTFRFPGRQR